MPIRNEFEVAVADFQHEVWENSWSLPDVDAGFYLYVLVANKEKLRFPIYVGQTRRFRGRMGDYAGKAFSASTDYKVGEGITALQQERCKLDVYYHRVEEPRFGEKKLIRLLQIAGYHLLNELSGYDYLNKEQKLLEEESIHRFARMLLREAHESPSAH